jgi:hypothetical protein
VTASGQLQVGDFTFDAIPSTIPAGASYVFKTTYSPITPGNDTGK